MNGTEWVNAASTDTPRNMVPRIVLMSTRVVRALLAWGSRKMLTPLEMASVPVMAELPLAKARSRKKAETPRISPPLAWPRAMGLVGAERTCRKRPRCFRDEAEDDEDRHVGDEEVGGDGEDLARLPDAPEVAEGQEHDEGDRTGTDPCDRATRRERPR